MIDYRFTLITPGEPDLVIDEPVGFSDIVQSFIRREEWHGVYFEATVNQLGFYGPAAAHLTTQKQIKGLKAQVTFLAEERCKAADPYEEVLRGRLNFGKFKSSCGLECTVTLPVEQDGCALTFNNRYDQAVDLDSLVAFDRITGLQNYAAMGANLTLAAQNLEVAVRGTVLPEGDEQFIEVPQGLNEMGAIRPFYGVVDIESIKTSGLQESGLIQLGGHRGTTGIGYPGQLSPQLLMTDNVGCFSDDFDYNIRMKGTFYYQANLNAFGDAYVKLKVVTWNGEGRLLGTDGQAVILHEVTLQSGAHALPLTFTFDRSFTGSVPLPEGTGFYAYLELFGLTNNSTALPDLRVTWDKETTFEILNNKSCPPTEAQVYMVNETLSRVAEAITNNCTKVKSDYYGRTDSQPYASGADGCGSLRVLLNGLKLRQAPENKMFLSMKDLFENMIRPIDNCGMGFEPNTELPGEEWLRIEPIDYFYQDVEVLRFPYVPTVNSEVDEAGHYSVIKVGYNKWEPRTVAGLDEFNSNREFRTSLETVRTTLDITSNFIAGGYAIETTRQESFSASGAADTTYDNDTFIICVDREVYGYKVEQGEIVSPANIYSPATAYNFRITPLRNLMRHFKSIINSYANIVDSAAKLFFSKGTGNYTATGQFVDACADENGPKAENIDLSVTDFKNPLDSLPLIRPENVNFRYPFGPAEWSKLRAQPNGYASVQCGTGEWLKIYITELQWEVRNRQAQVKGKVKWQ